MPSPPPADLGLMVIRLPALDHLLAAAPQEAVQALDDLLHGVRDRVGAAPSGRAVRREGDLVVAVVADPEALVELALQAVRSPGTELGAGAAIGWGPAVLQGDELFGAQASLTRRLALLARPGDLLCPDPLRERASLPEGVGAHLAPAALSRLVGVPVHVLRDYR